MSPTMQKTVLQFFTLVVVFLGVWWLLSQVPFTKHLPVARINKFKEKKLGDYMIENCKKNNYEIDTDSLQQLLDSLKNRVCAPNGINPGAIHIHLLHNDDVNAFALPGQHMVIYTGLLKYCDSASELCGIIAHEIGHMQHNHIMKRIVENIGITAVISVAGGNSQTVQKILTTLSSTAFSRKQEVEADAAAVDYLLRADIDPAGFGNILQRFGQRKNDIPKQMEWLSTHPNSANRAEEVFKRCNRVGAMYMPVISDSSWRMLKRVAQ